MYLFLALERQRVGGTVILNVGGSVHQVQSLFGNQKNGIYFMYLYYVVKHNILSFTVTKKILVQLKYDSLGC